MVWGEKGRGLWGVPTPGMLLRHGRPLPALFRARKDDDGDEGAQPWCHQGVVTPRWPPNGTLLFWRRRMMCSKQLLLRKTAWRTGRSSQLSMAGMASTARWSRLSACPVAPSPPLSPTTYPA